MKYLETLIGKQRIDELAPVLGAVAKKTVGTVAKKAAGTVAKNAAQKATSQDDDEGPMVSHTEYRRMGILMAEALGLREEDEDPKAVPGETPEQTQAVNKKIKKAMGPEREGAEGGIEGMKAKIRAAGAAAKGK